MAEERADTGWDDYGSRVLRNEGRLCGLEQLVKETRESDRKLIEQRSDSLAKELERRAEALVKLGEDERCADNREHRDALSAYKESSDRAAILLRELSDAAIWENRKQSDEAIKATEEHAAADNENLKQQVASWRASDREARDIASVETNRRLDSLNHADEKRQEFQANAVTRELFNADKEAQGHRENVLRDQIIALDRMMLGMTPTSVSEKAHSDVVIRFEAAIAAASRTLDTKIDVNSDKINDLRSFRDTTTGRSSGYTAFYGWIIAGFGLIATLIVIGNVLSARGL